MLEALHGRPCRNTSDVVAPHKNNCTNQVSFDHILRILRQNVDNVDLQFANLSKGCPKKDLRWLCVSYDRRRALGLGTLHSHGASTQCCSVQLVVVMCGPFSCALVTFPPGRSQYYADTPFWYNTTPQQIVKAGGCIQRWQFHVCTSICILFNSTCLQVKDLVRVIHGVDITYMSEAARTTLGAGVSAS